MNGMILTLDTKHGFIVDSAELRYKLGVVRVELNGKRNGLNGPAKLVLRKQGHRDHDPSAILGNHADRRELAETPENCGQEKDRKVSAYRLLQDDLALGHQPQVEL